VNLATCTTGFPYQQALMTDPCLSVGWANARVFKVDRFHYYIDRFADAVTGTRPYLMLDRGLWDGGKPLVEPVAPDVEDIQFAYVFPRSAAAQLVGTTAVLADAVDSIDITAAVPPAYTDLTSAASRTTHSPANIRAVRVSVVVRTTTPDPAGAGVTATIPAAANRPAITGDADYRRIVVETSEGVRNLDSRGPFFPAYSANPADGVNVGGG
jgi:type IV pilus assembly protein PilW